MEPFLGQLGMFAGTFPPRGWAFCSGQIIGINQNSALFALLGTTYGGNGQTTFGLPDLRGRAALHVGGSSGTGPGLSTHVLGEVSGSPSVSLLSTQMPMHGHGLNVTSAQGTLTPGNGAVLGRPSKGTVQNSTSALMYSSAAPTVAMTTPVVGSTGNNVPHNNMMPYLCINYIIALEGIFPSRN